VKIEPVDERVVGWNVDFPTYQVYFFDGGPPRRAGGVYGATTYTYRITEAHNVHQVFAWADANAQGRRFIVYVEWDDSRLGTGVLQLCGDDQNRPNDPHRDPPPELDPGPVEKLPESGSNKRS
jgi:hypothetical protein